MGLEGVVDKLSFAYKATKVFLRKEKKYCEAAALFLTTRTLDVVTSAQVISKYGYEGEAAPLTKHFMNLYGPNLGMVIEQASIGSLVLLTAYYLNKKNIKSVSGNNLLYGTAVISFGISAVNFCEYMGIPLMKPVLSLFSG